MPSGLVHSSSSIILSGAVVGTMAALDFSTAEITLTAGGVLLGILMSPDWDVDNGNVSDLYIRQATGRASAGIFSIWKRPYSLALEHRSFVSHFPIISTVVRIAYVFFPLLILLFRNQNTSGFVLTFYALIAQILSLALWYPAWFLLPYANPYGAYVFAGLVLSDTLHFLMDAVF